MPEGGAGTRGDTFLGEVHYLFVVTEDSKLNVIVKGVTSFYIGVCFVLV